MTEFWTAFLLSAAAGVLAGWGVGGGTLLLVCMTVLLGVDHRQAQAVNLLFFLPTAAVSLWFHRRNGLVDRKVWRQAVLPGTAAALAGAVLSLSLEVSVLRAPFGLFLIATGATMLLGSGKR